MSKTLSNAMRADGGRMFVGILAALRRNHGVDGSSSGGSSTLASSSSNISDLIAG
jgi:hypothetical protein